MTSWTIAALSPDDIAPQRVVPGESISPLNAFALIVAGRFWQYESSRREGNPGLPDLVDDTAVPDEIEWRLVWSTALAMFTETLGRGIEELENIASTDHADGEIRAVAALMASVGYDDLEKPGKAIELCRDLLSQKSISLPNLTLASLAQQMALRLAITGEYLDALSWSSEARVSLERLISVEVHEPPPTNNDPDVSSNVVRKIAKGILLAVEDNTSELNQLISDVLIFPMSPAWQYDEFWAEKDGGISAVGELYLRETFERQVRDPVLLVRPMIVRNEDSISSLLHSYLVGCELSGHWRRTRGAYAMLGRERLVRPQLGSSYWSKEQGLSLLRRSGDKDALEQALQHVRSEGPLEILVNEVRRVADNPPNPMPLASLVILEVGADLLPQESIGRVLDILLVPTGASVRKEAGRWFLHEDPLWKTISALARWTPQPDQLAFRVRARAAEADGLILTRLTETARNIPWEQVGILERTAWIEWARANFEGDSSSLSAIVLSRLASSGSSRASRVLVEGFAQHPNSIFASALVNLAYSGYPDGLAEAGEQIAAMSVEAMETARKDADRGAYSFGGVDMALIATALSLKLPNREIWDRVVAFLTDPNIASFHRAPALDHIAANVEKIPSGVLRELSARPQALESRSTDPFISIEPSTAILRFLCAASAIPSSRAIEELERLASDPEAAVRRQAAKTALYVARIADPSMPATVALALSRDSSVVVRAAAGEVLAKFLTIAPQALRPALINRMREMLRADGIPEPSAILRGIDVVTENREIPIEQLRDIIAALSIDHPAISLRVFATKMLEQPGRQTASNS